jgi:hypothetical protein
MTNTILTLLSYLFITLLKGPLGIILQQSSEFAQHRFPGSPDEVDNVFCVPLKDLIGME